MSISSIPFSSIKLSNAAKVFGLKVLMFVLYFIVLAVLAVLIGEMQAIPTSVDATALPDHKRTPLEKYLSSEDTFKVLVYRPDILFIDVRDPIEISQAGHPENIDAIVPFRIQTDQFDAELQEYTLVDNPDFVASMERVLKLYDKSKHHLIILTCGSGWRSVEAAKVLIEAGFTNVWHIPDGYKGEEKPGLNTKNAWKIAGLPWSYDLVPGSEWIKNIPHEERSITQF